MMGRDSVEAKITNELRQNRNKFNEYDPVIVRVAYQGLTYVKWNTGLSVPFCGLHAQGSSLKLFTNTY